MAVRLEPFWYSTQWSAAMAAVGAFAAPVVLITADAPFLCYRISGHVRQGAAGAEVLLLNWAGTVQIATGVGQTLFDFPLPMDVFVAPGAPPYELAPPYRFRANMTLTVTFTSNVVARTQCELVFHGAKEFPV